MLTLKGKYNSANIFIDLIDEVTQKQIQSMLSHPAFGNSYIAIMPDTHAGKGSVIGFTMSMNKYIIPNIVGVDIGCGIEAINLGKDYIDLEELDKFIKNNVPSGYKVHNNYQFSMKNEDSYSIKEICYKLNLEFHRVFCSIGTLGGGNHFIEVDQAPNGDKWLVIHSGSRNFGLQVAKYHQQKAKDLMKKLFIDEGAYKDSEFLPLDMGGENYLEDMKVAQLYAQVNRNAMFDTLVSGFFKKECYALERVSSVHNYINFEDKIIRKGAIQANDGQRCIIPFNMRDGVAICKGKGSKKYNNSAPHGAGRILSRNKAKSILKLEDYRKSMEGIYSTTVTKNTLDEAPMVYKDMQLILDNIEETVDVEFLMKPIYNFKAC